MASSARREIKALIRVAAVMLVGVGLCACSTVPDWVDPTTWMGPDVPDQTQADNGQYPDLSKIPNRPNSTSTPDQQKQVADSLTAARSDVQYSAQALRGGTEAAAPPPAAPAPAQKTQMATAQPEAQPASAPEPSATADDNQVAEAAPAPAAAPPSVAPSSSVAPAAEPPPAVAALSQPAVPAVPDTGTAPAPLPAVPANMTVGFAPSRAPALSASVAQFVPQPIIAQYAQTGPVGGSSGAVPASSAQQGTPASRDGTAETDVGGPESMSGAVVANLGMLDSSQVQPSVYTGPAGVAPVAVVLFPGNSTALNAAGRKKVRLAVQDYRARGGHGYIRVVGHSSGRTGNMSMVRHMEVNFDKSQARARAVARELIRQGIPADKVLVDAVGAEQPVYYESMPKGEAGNRRAEIFLQD